MTPRHVNALLKADSTFQPLVDRLGSIQLKPHRLPPFQSLVRAVIHQQLSGRVAEVILGRFAALFRSPGFPTPEQVLDQSPDTLRGVGLSHRKAEYIRSLATHALDGTIPTLDACEALSDQQLIDRLTPIRGIGQWTVEMLLIFNLGRPDVLPVDDLGVRKGFQVLNRKRLMPKPKALLKHGNRWAGHRTTAALYLWRAADELKP